LYSNHCLAGFPTLAFDPNDIACILHHTTLLCCLPLCFVRRLRYEVLAPSTKRKYKHDGLVCLSSQEEKAVGSLLAVLVEDVLSDTSSLRWWAAAKTNDATWVRKQPPRNPRNTFLPSCVRNVRKTRTGRSRYISQRNPDNILSATSVSGLRFRATATCTLCLLFSEPASPRWESSRPITLFMGRRSEDSYLLYLSLKGELGSSVRQRHRFMHAMQSSGSEMLVGAWAKSTHCAQFSPRRRSL